MKKGVCPDISKETCIPTRGGQPVDALGIYVPQTCVTREEARTYCRSVGKRLPTEAEWQFAATGGEPDRIFAWGDDFEFGFANIHRVPIALVDTDKRPRGQTPEGLYHISGNAYEWVDDDACAFDAWPEGAKQCKNNGEKGVVRGGSFASDGGGIRVTYRRFNKVDVRADTHGFRCARDAKREP